MNGTPVARPTAAATVEQVMVLCAQWACPLCQERLSTMDTTVGAMLVQGKEVSGKCQKCGGAHTVALARIAKPGDG